MTTVIEIAPRTDRQPSGFGHLRLYHHGCDQIPLIKHRNPLTQQYTVQCVCGLTIRLPAIGPAVEAFDLTAIDEQPRPVPSGSYSSTVDGELKVITKGAA
jgi:hypothetical protein